MSLFSHLPCDALRAAAALESGVVVCPASPAGLLRFTGEESQAFLHGQLSSDVKALADHTAQYSSYSNAKGRLQASFLLYRQGADYSLLLADELSTALQKRLSMFILRSKTRCSDISNEQVLLGLAGPKAAKLLQQITGTNAPAELTFQQHDNLGILALPGQRFLLITPTENAPAQLQQLIDAGAEAGDANLWKLTDIRAGIPWITPTTQEEFVAQMANLDLISAVSFSKGCYPGQEIIARTRYLGKLKRRMYRCRIGAETVSAGQDVFSPEMHGQASGKIMQAARLNAEQWEALVVAQISSVEHGLHLGEINGPLLQIMELPYIVE